MICRKIQTRSILLLAMVMLLRIPAGATAAIAEQRLQTDPSLIVASYAADADITLTADGATPESLPCSPVLSDETALIPGGIPFGVKFTTNGILIIGFCDVDSDHGKINPAYNAGLRAGDVILKLNDHTVRDAEMLGSLMEEGEGRPFTVTFMREKKEQTVTVTPAYSVSEGKYKSGIWIRDGGAGIGTVTFIDPESGMFAGLGHGICDGDTGQLIPMDRGTVIDVTISGIVRGQAGSPGEVKGHFNHNKLGSVFGNTDCGVFGLFTEIPSACGKAIPVAARGEIHDGKAELLCSLDSNTVTHYAVTISAIHRDATSNKCFTVTVTDPTLISKTGGIIQGMSGSPIIQDGKLVGAVTHVLVNDPTRGYGIFIENMLNAAD